MNTKIKISFYRDQSSRKNRRPGDSSFGKLRISHVEIEDGDIQSVELENKYKCSARSESFQIYLRHRDQSSLRLFDTQKPLSADEDESERVLKDWLDQL